jgi:hypothetical protein
MSLCFWSLVVARFGIGLGDGDTGTISSVIIPVAVRGVAAPGTIPFAGC